MPTSALRIGTTIRTLAPLRAGPRFAVVCVPILIALVTAMASTGIPQYVSALMATSWIVLAPAALFSRWVARLLPIASASFLFLALLTLPFNSPAFISDVWAALTMSLLTLPRQQ